MHSHRFYRSFITTSHLLLIIALVGMLLVAPAQNAHAADTLEVDIGNVACNNKSGPVYCHIQPAINAAQQGDIINVAAGQYNEFLTIAKSLTIVGAGAATTAVDGGSKGRVVNIDGAVDVTIAGVTIRGGVANNGAGILNASTLTLRDSQVTTNQADGNGGGIFSSGTLILTNSTISGNHAVSSGGGIYNSGTLTLTNSTISGNQAIGNGGGIFSSGAGALASATVTANSSTGSETQGSGIYHSGQGPFTLRNTILAL